MRVIVLKKTAIQQVMQKAKGLGKCILRVIAFTFNTHHRLKHTLFSRFIHMENNQLSYLKANTVTALTEPKVSWAFILTSSLCHT